MFPSCTTCDALFDSLLQLEYHKEQLEHFDGADDDLHDDEAYLGAAEDYFFEEEEAREYLRQAVHDREFCKMQ